MIAARWLRDTKKNIKQWKGTVAKYYCVTGIQSRNLV